MQRRVVGLSAKVNRSSTCSVISRAKTESLGMVQDYTDKQTRRFEVDIEGHVIGNTLTLNEDFVFDDGERANGFGQFSVRRMVLSWAS